MGILIAFYLGRVHNAQGGELPEDILTSDIDDGDPELGEFSPWSWWPIVARVLGGARHDGPRDRQLDLPDRRSASSSSRSWAGSSSTTAATSRADTCPSGSEPLRSPTSGRTGASIRMPPSRRPGAAAVADGVGGGPAGDLASAAFVHRLAAGGVRAARCRSARRERARRRTGICARTSSAIRRCTAWRRRSPASSCRRPGSLLLAHTGDSRAYRLRGGVLSQQTRDDSYVQALVDRGLVAAADAASHPRRNLITASLSGGERDVGDASSSTRPPRAIGGCCAATA